MSISADNNPSHKAALDSTLDDVVDRFEEAWNAGLLAGSTPDVVDFLPKDESSEFFEIAVELIRIDMERRAELGVDFGLSSYLDQHPWLRQRDELRNELAFEEFRQRRAQGDDVSPSFLAKTYDVETIGWPATEQDERDTQALRQSNESTYNILADNADRLISSIERFPEIGETIGDFTLRELLGEGKFARVYLAQQGELADRRVALKVSAELWTESEKLARLQHTHIVPIYSIHRIGALQALCMPFLGRQTLEQAIRADREDAAGPASFLGDQAPPSKRHREANICIFAAKLADALQHAHARGIIHRDLKPANVLLGDDGEPLILDFNLSENLVVGGPTNLLVGGTLPYMAPEHLQAVLSPDRLNASCDIYSLGVMLYQLTSGALPFPRRDGNFIESVTTMIRDRRRDQGWMDPLRRCASPDLASIIFRCLAADPAERYTSADQLRDDLLRHAGDLPLKFAPNVSLPQRIAKCCHRHRHRISLGSVLLLASIVSAAALAASAWQADRADRLEATRLATAFEQQFHGLQLPLLLGSETPSLRAEAVQSANAALGHYGLPDDPEYRTKSSFRLLQSEQQQRLDLQMGELLYLIHNAVEEGDATAVDKPPKHLAAAAACLFPNQPVLETWTPANLPEDLPLRKRLLALRMTQLGDYSGARPLLEEALQADAQDASLWLLYGFCQAAEGELSLAETSLTRCLALPGDSVMGYFYRGVVRMQQHRFAAAEADFTWVIQRRPTLWEAYENRAAALLKSGQFDAALADIDTVARLRPLGCRTLWLKAEILDGLGSTEEATHTRQQLLQIEPEDAVGWATRGRTWGHNHTAEAIGDFQQALRLRPHDKDALHDLAAMYAKVTHDPDSALQVLNDWELRYPRDARPRASAAVLLARLGKQDAAMAKLATALELGRTAETCYYAASACSLLSKQQPEYAERAVELLRECFQLDDSWFDAAIEDADLVPLRSNENLRKLLAAINLVRQRAEFPPIE